MAISSIHSRRRGALLLLAGILNGSISNTSYAFCFHDHLLQADNRRIPKKCDEVIRRTSRQQEQSLYAVKPETPPAISSTCPPTLEEPRKSSSLDDVIKKSIVWSNAPVDNRNTAPAIDGSLPLPCDPNSVDSTGPLPVGAFLMHGKQEHDAKSCCRVILALNAPVTSTTRRRRRQDDANDDPETIVRNMQKCIDNGLTSFQLCCDASNNDDDALSSGPGQAWFEEQVLRRLHRETPAFAMNGCMVSIPLKLPWSDMVTKGIQGQDLITMLRKRLLDSLQRVGGDAIDCVQLQLDTDENGQPIPDPLLFMEVLEVLQDWQREGLVRSVSCRQSSTDIDSEAMHRFWKRTDPVTLRLLDSFQLPSNLLDSATYFRQNDSLGGGGGGGNDWRIPLMVESPLAGGLLTDQYVDAPFLSPALFQNVGSSETRRMVGMLQAWSERRNSDNIQEPSQYTTASSSSPFRNNNKKKKKLMATRSPAYWNQYQDDLLPTLCHVALKHRVSVASVALRWILQHHDGVEHTVVASNRLWLDEGEYSNALPPSRRKPPRERQQQFRDVFRFQLDEEDMEELWQVSAQEYLIKEQQRRRDTPWLDDELEQDEAAFYASTARTGSGLFLPNTRKGKRRP